MSAEYLELEDILTEEKRLDAKRKHENAVIEAQGKKSKVRDKEKLIDDLMFSDKDSKFQFIYFLKIDEVIINSLLSML